MGKPKASQKADASADSTEKYFETFLDDYGRVLKQS